MKILIQKMLPLLMVISLVMVYSCDDGSKKETKAPTKAKAKTYKMTTQTPPGVLIPDEVETRIGKLEFFDGVPTEETAQLIWDQQDFSRAVECMIMSTNAASLVGFRKGIREYGPDNETVVWWKEKLDSKSILLTGNTTVIYLFTWLNTKDGPIVLECPPGMLGIIDDFWFQYVADVGNAGPDKGKGGKYLLLPPGYDGKIPSGYYVLNSKTYGNWLALRGFAVDGSYNIPIKNMESLKIYPLAEKKNPTPNKFYDLSGKYINTLHSQDITFFEEVNEVVQEENNEAWDIEALGLLASIGIEKGKPFAPDTRMKKILAEAAVVGSATQRAILFRNRDTESVELWPGSKSWEKGFAGGSYKFEKDGVRLINNRVRFHYYATGITPVMVTPPVGAGSQYVIGLRDETGEILNGGNNYKLHIPKDVPVLRFWEVTVYDNQTRSMLQTDQRLPGITSIQEDLVKNDDGSFDVYFGPEKPDGKVNWIQTVPDKGWNMLWRVYSPTQVWYDKTWRPGEIKKVD